MFNFLPGRLPLTGLVLLCATATAQAQMCAKNNMIACDLTVTPPVTAVLFCGLVTPTSVTYTITNNTPAPKQFTYDLVEPADPIPSGLDGGIVVIDTVATSASCGGTPTVDGGSATLAAGASCNVVIDVTPDDACLDTVAFNWELEVAGAFPQSGEIVSVIPVIEEPLPATPVAPNTFICPSDASDTPPLCSTTDFCVFGDTGVNNTNLLTHYTHLNNCDAGNVTGNMQLVMGGAANNMFGGTIYSSDATAGDAELDIQGLLTAFSAEAAFLCGSGLGYSIPPGYNLGNGANYSALPRGLYCFNTAEAIAYLKGGLVLEGIATDQWIFVMPNSFDVQYSLANLLGNAITFTGGAVPENVWWVVFNRDAATTSTNITPGLGSLLLPGSFQGNVYSVGGITLGHYVNIPAGRLFSSEGVVTLYSNTITLP